MKLYAVYLGGDLEPGRMGEDHEVVFVVGEDECAVRTAAKRKWRGRGSAHVDAVERIEVVDGYRVALIPSGSAAGDVLALDAIYDPPATEP